MHRCLSSDLASFGGCLLCTWGAFAAHLEAWQPYGIDAVPAASIPWRPFDLEIKAGHRCPSLASMPCPFDLRLLQCSPVHTECNCAFCSFAALRESSFNILIFGFLVVFFNPFISNLLSSSNTLAWTLIPSFNHPLLIISPFFFIHFSAFSIKLYKSSSTITIFGFFHFSLISMLQTCFIHQNTIVHNLKTSLNHPLLGFCIILPHFSIFVHLNLNSTSHFFVFHYFCIL